MRNQSSKSLPISDPLSISNWISNFIAKPIQNKKQILTEMLCEYHWFVDLHKQLYIRSPTQLNQYSKLYNTKKNNELIKLDMSKKIQKINKKTFTSQDQCKDNISMNEDLLSTNRSFSNYDIIKLEDFEQINNKLKQTQVQLIKKNNQIKQLQQQKTQLMSQNKKNEAINRNLKDKIKKILVDIKQQLSQLKNKCADINDKTIKISQIKAQTNLFMTKQLNVYNQILKLQKLKIETITKQLKAIQKQNEQKQIQILNQQKQKQKQKEKQKQKQKQKQINKLVNYQQLVFTHPSICFMHSNILPILPVKKQININENIQIIDFLLNSVNSLYKKTKVKALKPLYSFHNFRNTKVNFHALVDNIPNLLLIIKLKNKSIIGVYSQSGITQKNPSNKNKGLMCQSVDRKVYLPKQKYDTNPIMRYDEYYINVGNQDILIRVDSEKIESCFNSITSLFRPNSDYNFNNIFHEGPNTDTVELQDYEFYQIFIF